MTASSLREFAAVQDPTNTTSVVKVPGVVAPITHKAPAGWEPHMEWKGDEGFGVSKPRVYDGTEVDHAELLKEWGFDPEQYSIDGALEYRQWDANVGAGEIVTLRYYKAKVVRRHDQPMASLPALIDAVKKHKKPKRVQPLGDDAFVVCLSDWQLGKGEGTGSVGTVARLLKMIDEVEERVLELRKIGRPLGTLYVLGLGDIVEGCTGFYPNQEFEVDLNQEEQRETAIHLLIAALKRWSPLFEKVVVAAVGGNHGENRKEKGGSYTNGAKDNTDIGVFKTTALVLRENPAAYGHVSFVFPEDRMTLLLNVAGVNIGLVHGHQFRGGGKLSQGKAQEWWKGQIMGLQPISNAQILVSAHFHHYSCIDIGPRTHFQTPSMDPGSIWVAEGMGYEARTGTLTFRITPGEGDMLGKHADEYLV